MMALAVTAVAAHFYTRHCLIKSLGMDDWLSLLALICFCALGSATVAEPCSGILCVVLPTLHPLHAKFFPRVGNSIPSSRNYCTRRDRRPPRNGRWYPWRYIPPTNNAPRRRLHRSATGGHHCSVQCYKRRCSRSAHWSMGTRIQSP